MQAIGCFLVKIDGHLPDALNVSTEVARARHVTINRFVEGPVPAGIPMQIEVNCSPTDEAVQRRKPSTWPEANGSPITPYPDTRSRSPGGRTGRSSTSRAKSAGAFIRSPYHLNFDHGIVDRRRDETPVVESNEQHRASPDRRSYSPRFWHDCHRG